jgi:hypothetical protein
LTYPKRKMSPSAESGNSKPMAKAAGGALCKRGPSFATGVKSRESRRVETAAQRGRFARRKMCPNSHIGGQSVLAPPLPSVC